MNILIDRLPNEYEGLELNTDFRTSILFELMMQDNSINDEDKIALAINLYYSRYPKSIEELNLMKNGIIWFYGREDAKIKKDENVVLKKPKNKRIYSFEHDQDMIFSAFMEEYKIDLTKENMHWWKFKALFNSLSDETMFVKAMQYRSINLAEIQDKNQRKRYANLQKTYALPDSRTDEEKEQDFANALW